MKTMLQFNSLFELTSFQASIKTRSYHIDKSTLILTGIFSEAEIELAEESYRARQVHTAPNLQRVA